MDLSHIRKIHFSFILLSAFCFYLLWANWIDNEAVADSIREFSLQLRKVRNLDSLDCVNDSTTVIKTSLRNTIKDQVGIDSIEFGKIYEALGPSRLPDANNPLHDIYSDTTESIEVKINKLEKTNLTLRGIRRIRDNLADVKRYGVDQKSKIIEIKISAWRQDSTQYGVLNLTLRGAGVESTFQKSFEAFDWNCLKYDESFRSKFKPMFDSWDAIKDRSISNAIKWAENQPIESIGSVDLFGVHITSKGIGWVFITLAFSFLIYLNTYLRELKPKTVEGSWVGTMQNRIAALLTFLTFWIGPILSIFLPFQKLISWPIPVEILFSLVGEFISIQCWWISRNIALAGKINYEDVALLMFLRRESSFRCINIILHSLLIRETRKLDRERLNEILADEEKILLEVHRLMETYKIPSSEFLEKLNFVIKILTKIGAKILPKSVKLQVAKWLKDNKTKKLFLIGSLDLQEIRSISEKQMKNFALLT